MAIKFSNPSITTQRTSKPLKLQLVLSAWLFWFGIIPLFIYGEFYLWAVVIGGAWYMIIRVLVWWHHE